MPSQATIHTAIALTIGDHFSDWRIGLTHEPEVRKAYWRDDQKQDVSMWSQWKVNSLAEAEELEAFFIGKGVKGGTGGNLDPSKDVFVYIF